MIGGVRLQQLVAEPQHLGLVGDVAGMAGHPYAGRRFGLGQRYGHRGGVGMQVAGRDRAPPGRELPDKLAAHPRAAAGHYRELVREPVHTHNRYRRCHCSSTIQGACTSTIRRFA